MTSSLSSVITSQKKKRVLLVLTGPTGAGKDTIIDCLVQNTDEYKRIITTTTRPMRQNESQGNPYHFVSEKEFDDLIQDDKMFEWVHFRTHRYGTQKTDLMKVKDSKYHYIWRIDVEGVIANKKKLNDIVESTVYVFLTGPTKDVMKKRVEKQNGRWNEEIVENELKKYTCCDYLVVNEDENLDKSIREIASIVQATSLKI